MTTLTPAQKKVFEDFKSYPWLEDKVFQSGVNTILRAIAAQESKRTVTPPTLERDYQDYTEDTQHTLQILRAKHFYYSKYKGAFKLEDYLAYELEQTKLENEAAYARLEKYEFDQDKNYLEGLPNIIQAWVQQQMQEAVLWDKSRLEAEFTKAKAFYYSACIEPIRVTDYLILKSEKERKDQPACPFANLWQNKGKVSSGRQVISDEFLTVEPSICSKGPTIITLASPRSQNKFTVSRLKQLDQALDDTTSSKDVNSVLLTATVFDTMTPAMMMDDRVSTHDTKIISSGLAYEDTYQQLLTSVKEEEQEDSRHKMVLTALDHLGASYYDYIRHQHLQQQRPQEQEQEQGQGQGQEQVQAKPTFMFLNGQVPLNAAYMTLWHGYMRIATEHVMMKCELQLSHAPVPPLLLFQLCERRRLQSQQKATAATPLPAGWDLYLAMAPPELARLRAPELLRLGFVDVFVPEMQLGDVFSNAKRMALCPPPLTSTAVQMTLTLHHSYPGPDRISTWQSEIQSVFGAKDTVSENDDDSGLLLFSTVLRRLRQMQNVWSQNILAHWESLPPVLVKVVFRAVQLSRSMSPYDMLAMEEKLNTKWRQSLDYRQYLSGRSDWTDSWEDMGDDDDNDDDLVLAYFNDEEKEDKGINKDGHDEKPFVYEVSEKDLDNQASLVSVCPVTGQQSSSTANVSGCPFSSGQSVSLTPTNTSADPSESVCPVTGQRSSTSSSATSASGCPFSSGQPVSPTPTNTPADPSERVCPVTGQHSSAPTTTNTVCPFSSGIDNGANK